MIRRKKLEDEDDDPGRWLISYADFMTLLFAFFVVMYAISTINLSKYQQLSHAVGAAFTGKKSTTNSFIKQDNAQESTSQTSILQPLPLSYLYQEKYRREQAKMRAMGQSLSNMLAPLVEEKKIRLNQNQRGVKIDIQDTLLFESGSAILTNEAKPIISRIANTFKPHQRLIQIEGHTDSMPIQNEQFQSNWELSAQRATAVLRMMVDDGIEPQRLSAIALADTQPLSSSDTALGQASNRRVSIWILLDTLADNPMRDDMTTEEIIPDR